MKKAIYIIATLAITHSTMARIIRVAPNTLSGALFTTAQAAHNAANPGDSIYLEGISSPLDYGVLTITTPIVLVGKGWNLDESPSTQYNSVSAKMNHIYIRPSAAGTKIISIELPFAGIYISANNVTIDQSKIFSSGIGHGIFIGENATLGSGNLVITGLLVQRCYLWNFNYISRNVSIYTYYGIVSNAVIKNNIIGNSLLCHSTSTFLIQNNSLLNISDVSNSIVKNNIFVYFNLNNTNTYYNNIGILLNTTYWNGYSGSGNITSNLFTDSFQGSGSSYGNNYYRAILSGAANNTGDDGRDIGPFGGMNPYVPFGIPPLPSITNLVVPSTSGNTINVTIDAQINR